MKKLLSLGMVLGLLACAKAPQGMTGTSDSTVAGIIGGDAVSADDPMAHTTVQIFAQTDEGVAGCTGSLVAADVILTAGHCSVSNPNDIIIYFSKDVPSDLQSFFKDWRQNPLVRQVVGGVTNPAWAKLKPTQKANWGDMSLLKLEKPAPSGYEPATLISEKTALTNGESITLAGFGLIQPLVNGNQVETTELRKVDVTVKNAKYSKTEILLDTSHGKGSCHGDSGGPGFVSVGGQNVIAAITSRADISTDPNGECTGNVIYTAVAPYLSWISETVTYLDSADFKPAPIAQPDLGTDSSASPGKKKGRSHNDQAAQN
jgi:secreted trypsin-like serine protease